MQLKWPSIRLVLRRYGVWRVVTTLTTVVVTLSGVTTAFIMWLRYGEVSLTGMLLSVGIPAVLVPLFEYRALSTLLHLDIAEEKLKITSTIDDLTQAYNRRHFFDIAGQELARAQRYGGIFSVAIMDIDHFKNVNDQYGHLAGDQVLREVSSICDKNIRLPDIFARYGGDEFIFLFPQTSKEKAREGLERVRASISQHLSLYENSEIKIHVSIGIAEFSNKTRLIDNVLKEADKALYQAKHDGGDKISS